MINITANIIIVYLIGVLVNFLIAKHDERKYGIRNEFGLIYAASFLSWGLWILFIIRAIQEPN